MIEVRQHDDETAIAGAERVAYWNFDVVEGDER